MLKYNRLIILSIIILFSLTNVKCQVNRQQYMPTQSEQRTNMNGNALAREENQMNFVYPQNAMPFIVKDVTFKSDKNIENLAQVKNDKTSRQNEQNGKQNLTISVKTVEEDNIPSNKNNKPRPVNNANGADMSTMKSGGQSSKEQELQKIVQQIFVAQAQVQLEANEIQRAQSVTANAQQALEEAANNVRVITAALHAAQETVAAAALRAQTAQLQLAAHDQLLFTARQKVDALSAQMVGLQAEEGIGAPRVSVDVPGLIGKLKQPLADAEKPTSIPSILKPSGLVDSADNQNALLLNQFQPPSLEMENLNNNLNEMYERLKNQQRSLEQLSRNAKVQNQEIDEVLEPVDFVVEDSDSFSQDEAEDLNFLNDFIEKRDNSAVKSEKSDKITEKDIKNLVHFILATEHNNLPIKEKSVSSDLGSPEKVDSSREYGSSVSGNFNFDRDEHLKKAENQKYFIDFLNSIKNLHLNDEKLPIKIDENKNDNSKETENSKLTDRILSLYESIQNPLNAKQKDTSVNRIENDQISFGNQFSNRENENYFNLEESVLPQS